MFEIALIVLGFIFVAGSLVMSAMVLGMQIKQKPQDDRMLAYLDSIERYCANLSEDVQEQERLAGQFHTRDGKYHADTLDDLMRQMMSGNPQSAEDVAKFLKDINSEIQYTPDDHEEYDETTEQEDDEDEPFM